MRRTPSRDRPPISEEAQRFESKVRSPEDLQRLSDFDRRIYVPLLLSALLPIVVAAGNAANDSGVSIVVNVVAWIVFIVDLVVHARLIRHFLRSRVGIFDLVVVIITAPWFLIPGFSGSQVLMLARLARLVRLLFVSKSARRAINRLGKVGLFALGMLLFASWMAYVAENPNNPGFATFGDALWWGIVTLTTVGYGDIVPVTEAGRIAGTALMLTGVATLGLIAGTLASVFGVTPPGTADSPPPPPEPAVPAAPGPGVLTEVPSAADVVAELAAVRAELAAIERRLGSLSTASSSTSTPDTTP